VGAAQGAGDREPGARHVHRLAEIDGEIAGHAISTAAFAGVVVETEGAASLAQTLSGEAVFLGVGAPTA